MKNKNLNLRKNLAGFVFLASFSVNAQDVPVATGEYAPDWDNLGKWECPEWYQDVKFGIGHIGIPNVRLREVTGMPVACISRAAEITIGM